jgi:hypothetical protein
LVGWLVRNRIRESEPSLGLSVGFSVSLSFFQERKKRWADRSPWNGELRKHAGRAWWGHRGVPCAQGTPEYRMCSLPNDPVLARRVVAGIIFLVARSLARSSPRHSHLLIAVLAGCAKFTWRSRWAGRVLRLCARNQWAQVRCIPFYLCLCFALFIISHKTSLLTKFVNIIRGVGGSYRVDQNSDVLRTECQNNVDRVVKLMVYSSKEMNIRAVDMTPVCYCPQPPFTL